MESSLATVFPHLQETLKDFPENPDFGATFAPMMEFMMSTVNWYKEDYNPEDDPVDALWRLYFTIYAEPNPKFTLPFQENPIPIPWPVFRKVKAAPLSIINHAPPIPTLPEVMVNNTMFFAKTGANWCPVNRNILRMFMLEPSLPCETFTNMEMAPMNMIKMRSPTHLLDLGDLRSQSQVLEVLIKWWMRNQRTDQWNLIPPELQFLSDPSPMFPQFREHYQSSSTPINLEYMSFCNQLNILQFFKTPMLKIDMSWAEAACGGRLWKVLLLPLLAPLMEGSRICVSEDQGEAPNQDFNMMIVAWNARGIGRKGFRVMVNHLWKEHSPDALFVSEIRVGRTNALKIIKSLPFDSYELAEPVGFSGGALLLWNADRISFSTRSKDLHSIHGTIQGNSGQGCSYSAH